ncbi:hypothetical protein C5C07_15270 [Haloferax sp. Atlit-4N]|uniref:hypothetical protein n=1 Tax=Haloferax sp. Atlit-4N TaxID=2077206 RepID=UPI000E222160|nr:hypothetical protein [Haloferax sp. Atlit-4N]RDZ53093.1 hypothetical protein C5C07_15270 [Haloferax sp. Atlit-4N]
MSFVAKCKQCGVIERGDIEQVGDAAEDHEQFHDVRVSRVATDGGRNLKVCPRCDKPHVRKRSPATRGASGRDEAYYCGRCGFSFDEPGERPRGTSGGIPEHTTAARLEAADPEDLGLSPSGERLVTDGGQTVEHVPHSSADYDDMDYVDDRGVRIFDTNWTCPNCGDVGELMFRPGSKNTCATCFWVIDGPYNDFVLRDWPLKYRDAQRLLASMGEDWHGTPGTVATRLHAHFDSGFEAEQAWQNLLDDSNQDADMDGWLVTDGGKYDPTAVAGEHGADRYHHQCADAVRTHAGIADQDDSCINGTVGCVGPNSGTDELPCLECLLWGGDD